jgi:hypothetical protein
VAEGRGPADEVGPGLQAAGGVVGLRLARTVGEDAGDLASELVVLESGFVPVGVALDESIT